ncbi:PIR Superfamily Protein [Plasmodium ovale curtisi]|uniref:PIR Superfamily Protein n=1 Tax=Plasmodium ovale curtisi TaxID=864141 RepID=A0A1A8VZE0_PLAOA|nr:PIR Superfamily Protein [Plasmodium ovale curtisi]
MTDKEDPDISSLQSEVIYHQLDRGLKDYMHDKGAFWEYVIKVHILKDLTIFRKLAKGFYYVSTMKEDDEIFYDTRWNYLYFWTGSKVLESSENSYFSEVMNLLKTVKSVNDNSISYNDDLFKISEEQFKNLKRIYDYLENYQTINLRIGLSINASCTAAYRNYVTATHDFYIEEKTRCQRMLTDNYCKLVNSFVHEYDKNQIKKLLCDGKKDPNAHSGMEDVEEDLGSSRPHLPVQEERTEALHLDPHQKGGTRALELPTGDISSSSGSTSALTTVFPLLGTASLAFFFLKFTPLGSRLYNRIFSKQIIRTNVEEPQKLLENSYEFLNTNTEENSHHIGYHSM